MTGPIIPTTKRELTHLRVLLENERIWRAEDVAILSTMRGKIRLLLHTLMEFVIATHNKTELMQIKKIRRAVADLFSKIFEEINVVASRDQNPRITMASLPTLIQLRRAVDGELNAVLAAAEYLIQSGKPANAVELAQKIKGEIIALRTLEREEDVVSSNIIGIDLTKFGAPVTLKPLRDQKQAAPIPPLAKARRFWVFNPKQFPQYLILFPYPLLFLNHLINIVNRLQQPHISALLFCGCN